MTAAVTVSRPVWLACDGMQGQRAAIAILTQITDASYGVWNQPSVVLPAAYVTELQRAGAIALVADARSATWSTIRTSCSIASTG